MAEWIVRGSALSTTFTMRREVLERVNGFDETLRRFTDLDFVLSVLEEHEIGYFPDPLALYRDHPGNLSKNLWGFFVGRYRLSRKWRFEVLYIRDFARETLDEEQDIDMNAIDFRVKLFY